MIYLIMPGQASKQLKKMAAAALEGIDHQMIDQPQELPDLRNQKIIFALELDHCGGSGPMIEMLSALCQRGPYPLQGATAALLVNSQGELYTKSAAAQLIFITNQLGACFIGHPLVEATGSLNNFATWQKTMDLSLEEISLVLSKQLGNRLLAHRSTPLLHPKLVFLHSSFRATSNTLTLWQLIADHLQDWDCQELYVENGSVFDCFGCSYRACVEYGQRKSCFYGGVMTEKILPAVEAADILVWICPNYNDAISSNLMAVINRLTTLYRQIRFYDKTIFSVIVSGNSGGDSIARQLIDALNINKGFYLPPDFALMETANDRGSVLKIPDIEEKARQFAAHMKASVM